VAETKVRVGYDDSEAQEGMTRTGVSLERMENQYNRMGALIVLQNANMAMSTSGLAKEHKELAAIMQIVTTVTHSYLTMQMMANMQHRMAAAAKRDEAGASLYKAGGSAMESGVETQGMSLPMIAMAVGTAIGLIATIYGITKMERGGSVKTTSEGLAYLHPGETVIPAGGGRGIQIINEFNVPVTTELTNKLETEQRRMIYARGLEVR